ncbi:Uncharacterised protein [Bordetella pertussis]|nr:Uncharacterised protein [Bordetella pertussis]
MTCGSRARHALDAFEQRDLVGRRQGDQRIDVGIKAAAVDRRHLRRHLDLARSLAGNAAHRARRRQQRVGR